MYTEEREPSYTFSFGCDAHQLLDLPSVCTPTGESAALFSEASVFGWLSREQSREHSSEFPCDLLDPASDDCCISTDTSTSTDESRAEPMVAEFHWSQDLKDLFENEPSVNSPEPEHEYQPEQASNKRKLEDHEHEEASPEEREAKRQRTPVEAAQTGKRGAHMKERPEQHQKARNAQQHWAQKAGELRGEWQQMRMWEKHDQFQSQIQMCSRLHIKSQHECVLRQLQLALVEGLINLPANKEFTSDTQQSFLGWTGFEVAPTRGAEFRRRIEDMFATPPSQKTLNNTLRRAGLVPERGWGEAWNGVGAFVFDQAARVHYGAKQEAE